MSGFSQSDLTSDIKRFSLAHTYTKHVHKVKADCDCEQCVRGRFLAVSEAPRPQPRVSALQSFGGHQRPARFVHCQTWESVGLRRQFFYPGELGPVVETPEAVDRRAARARSLRLQDQAARLAPGRRVERCGRSPSGSVVDVRRGADGRAHFGGLQTCGSVWLCPCCAARITESRRAELEQAMQGVRSAGCQVYMLTLTVPHNRHDDLRTLLDRMLAAYRYMVSGRYALARQLADSGLMGTVRALEVTHGANGWHPHLHVLILTSLPIDIEVVSRRLFDRWQRACTHHDLGLPDRAAFDLAGARIAGDVIAGYVVKFGAESELTKAHTKRGRVGGRTPWQLLEAAAGGDDQAAALWAEYAYVFHGRRQLVWSQGLRALLGLGAELSDEELAAKEPEIVEVLHRLTREQWGAVRRVRGGRALVLDAAELGSAPLLDCLARLVDSCSGRLQV